MCNRYESDSVADADCVALAIFAASVAIDIILVVGVATVISVSFA